VSSRTDPPRPFDPVNTPWFFPLILLGLLLPLRIFAPQVVEKPELFWLDEALNVRAKLGFASALDPSIHFVEMTIDDDIAGRFATDGELATTASVLKTIATLGARVIVVDIIYAYGRKEDQALLSRTIEEINTGGRTTVVLALSQETRPGAKPYLQRSLPLAGGENSLQGVVNVKAGKNWREYQMVHRFEGKPLPSIALAAFGASRSGPLAPALVADSRMEWKSLGADGKAVSAFADDSRVFLNLPHSYYNDHFDEREGIGERFWKIAELETRAKQGEQTLLDTIVFFGFDSEYDGKPTTHGDMEPGMFLHGTALNDLLHGRSIRPAPLWIDLVLYLLVALIAAATFSLVQRKRRLILVALAGVPLILIAGWCSIWFLELLPSTINAALLWGSAVFLEAGRR
jgi:CHASE2 domain-containing sensor protein